MKTKSVLREIQTYRFSVYLKLSYFQSMGDTPPILPMAGWGECLPYFENKITLDKQKTDKFGFPLIRISFSYNENERRMMEDIQSSAAKMFKDDGFEIVTEVNTDRVD